MNYLDGQIGKTFEGSFCYERKLTNYGRKLGKECICAKNLCNSGTDIKDTADAKLMKVLKTIQSDVQAIRKSTSPLESKNRFELRCLIILISLFVTKFNYNDKIR